MSNSPWNKADSSPTHSANELLRRLFKASQEYTKVLGEELDVNQTDFKVMEYLMENGPSSPGAIASAVGVTAGALTQSLDRLEKVGHTHREQNPEDRRSIRVVPNPNSVNRAWAEIMPLIETSTATLEAMSKVQQDAVVHFLEQMLLVYEEKVRASKQDF